LSCRRPQWGISFRASLTSGTLELFRLCGLTVTLNHTFGLLAPWELSDGKAVLRWSLANDTSPLAHPGPLPYSFFILQTLSFYIGVIAFQLWTRLLLPSHFYHARRAQTARSHLPAMVYIEMDSSTTCTRGCKSFEGYMLPIYSNRKEPTTWLPTPAHVNPRYVLSQRPSCVPAYLRCASSSSLFPIAPSNWRHFLRSNPRYAAMGTQS
jgi:hypothetical protein